MVYDRIKRIQLDVSDVRESILHNLRARFARAGIAGYRSFVKDLSAPVLKYNGYGQPGSASSKYDLIIIDAPCSGSGTWGRIPEMLSFFNAAEIRRYSRLQEKITAHAVNYLDKNGYLLYITCSVFKEENERIVQIIRDNYGLHLLEMELIQGYGIKADTLFAAMFTSSAI